MDPFIPWFILAAILLIGYAILDGFDLGVGILHLFAHSDEERRLYRQAVSPAWDGNELWLLAGLGTLFFAFPGIQTSLLGGSWLAPALLVLVLFIRSAFQSLCRRLDNRIGCRLWSRGLGLASLVIVLFFGALLGNVLRGIPLDKSGVFTGNLVDLLNPYALLVSIVAAILVALHGAVWLAHQSAGGLRTRMPQRIRSWWQAFLMCYLLVTIATMFVAPHLFVSLPSRPAFWIMVVLLLAGVVGVPLLSRLRKFSAAGAASSLIILSLLALTVVGIYPRLVPSSLDLAFSLTVRNTAAPAEVLSQRLLYALLVLGLLLLLTLRSHRRKGMSAAVEGG
ncbi:MAG: cytochrome d ubiquinol oxidase subunit II [Acidobacteria bacterium]|nr:cytochrome d ubiquinol oxidase subunit II [Acidobacteriota bacterium]